jgi:hypothetical protein
MTLFGRSMVARNSAGSCLLLLSVALALGACGRKEEALPAAAPEAPPPAAPAEAGAELESAPAPAPASAPPPSKQETPSSARDAVGDDEAGRFAEPPQKDDLRTAEAELERARRELDSALGVRRPRPAPTSGASRGADADRAEAAPAPKAEKKASETGCPTACRAFSSLGRAASAVCRLAGEKDARCTRAHGMVADAEKRVAACGCRGQ